MTARDRLGAVISTDLLELLDAYIAERVHVAVAELDITSSEPAWLTLEQAGELLSCSADAIRMRVKRGRLEARHQGRRVYVSRTSVDGA